MMAQLGKSKPFSNVKCIVKFKGRKGLKIIQDFKVVCDETNNTAQVIDSNNFVADIYIKPNRSINFIQLNFIATPSGVSFAEYGG